MDRFSNTRLIGLLLVGLCSVVFLSCDSQLKEDPDFINPDGFFKDASSLEQATTAIYQNLNDRWFNHFYNRFVFEEIVGYQVGWEKGPLDFQNGNVDPTDQYISAYWEISYDGINRANLVIAKANELEGEVSDEQLRRRSLAEAKFMRSFYYFNLIRYFDDVPFSTEPTSQLENPSTENGKRKVLDMMFADLPEAAGVLPSSYSGADQGRATKWAAKTLLMKAYLVDQQWQQARSVAEDIISNSPHGLYDNFAHNFDIAHENDPNGERIFEMQVSASVDASQNMNNHAHFAPRDHEFGHGWGWLWGTKQFRMRYDNSDERIPGTFLESYKSNRPAGDGFTTIQWSAAKDFSLGRTGGLVANGADPSNPNELTYSAGFTSKWVENCGGRSCWPNTEKNVVLMRYADVMLGHTEASLESGSGGQYDMYYGINEIRQRAGLSTYSGLSTDALRDSLVEAYVREFAFEQKTYPFLRRKSSFNGNPDYLGEQIRRFVQNHDVNRSVKQTDYALPLPLDEVQGNPNATQHPFWQ